MRLTTIPWFSSEHKRENIEARTASAICRVILNLGRDSRWRSSGSFPHHRSTGDAMFGYHRSLIQIAHLPHTKARFLQKDSPHYSEFGEGFSLEYWVAMNAKELQISLLLLQKMELPGVMEVAFLNSDCAFATHQSTVFTKGFQDTPSAPFSKNFFLIISGVTCTSMVRK